MEISRSQVYSFLKTNNASVYRMMARIPIVPIKYQIPTYNGGRNHKREREPVYCSHELEQAIATMSSKGHHKQADPENKLSQLRAQLLKHLEKINHATSA